MQIIIIFILRKHEFFELIILWLINSELQSKERVFAILPQMMRDKQLSASLPSRSYVIVNKLLSHGRTVSVHRMEIIRFCTLYAHSLSIFSHLYLELM